MKAIKTTGAAVVLLAMFVMLTACGSSKSVKQGTEEFSISESKYHEALSLYDNAMYFECIQAWKEVLDDEPRFAQGHFNVGLVYDKLNMIPEAIEHYELAVQMAEDTNNTEGGRQFVEDKRSADAAMALYNLHLGAAYLRSDLIDEAIDALNQAQSIDQYNPTIHYNLSAAFIATKNWDEALIHADKAVDLAAPGTGVNKDVDLMALGNYLLRQAECHAARDEWEKAQACIDRARAQCSAVPSGNLKEMIEDKIEKEKAAKEEAEKKAASPGNGG